MNQTDDPMIIQAAATQIRSAYMQLLSAKTLERFLSLSELIDTKNLTAFQLLKIQDTYEQLKRNNLKIRYTYTNDEYGDAARELQESKWQLKYAYEGDAGIDLPIVLSKEDREKGHCRVWPNERIMLHTGLIMEFPVGYHGRIIHRSSCERQYRLRIIEGIIDDYRGELLIQVANQNTCSTEVCHGNRLAQLIILPNCSFGIEQAEELRPSHRAAKGFGSTNTVAPSTPSNNYTKTYDGTTGTSYVK